MNIELLISGIARALLLPPFSFFLLFAAGWALSRRWPKTGRAVTGVTLVLAVVLCTMVGANLIVEPLEAMTRPLDRSRTAGAQAIVVLSAGTIRRAPEYGGASIPDYVALARLRYAAKLQHETGLPILVSGGIASLDRSGAPLAAGMARALREDFVTPVTWLEDQSINTAENAVESAKILLPAGRKRILLVTDAMHMPRAERQFRRAGFDVVAAPTMFMRTTHPGLFDFLPTAEGLRRAHDAVYEWIGLLWYRIRYP
jgi:uncharacterized SAM-binding protein YcdF (DUF218 family)